VQLAYCQTVHSSQALTRERVLVLLGGPMMNKHLAYVAASRCQDSCHLVADKATTAVSPNIRDAIRTLGAALSRDRTKDLAMDVVDATRKRQQERGISLGF
jgi:ATP-dependent exoDNAse (exonuclease V) alpha subunit